MAKFLMKVLVDNDDIFTTRLGAAGGYYTDKEVGKFVKLAAESQYSLCAVGDQIEGYITSVETATADNFTIGSVMPAHRKFVTCDGLQATPGTGTIAVGDYVVCGTVVAKDTKLTAGVPAKVCKATTQTGMYFAWRVVSLNGTAGAVGTFAVIERVNAS